VFPKTSLIIGAGIAGLTAARRLAEHGCAVTVVDKGRGPGGRMATRRIGSLRFDHGAQYFSAISPRFRAAVAEWERAGVAHEWFRLNGKARYRGAQGMSSIAKHMAAGLDVRTGVHVEQIGFEAGEWHVRAKDGGPFRAEALLLTAPVPQSLELLGPLAQGLPQTVRAVRYFPCFALMLAIEDEAAVPAPGWARPASGPVSWVAGNHTKGISEGPGALTLHATPEFSRTHFDEAPEQVAARLMDAASPWFGGARPGEWQLHRWRYSLVSAPGPEPCVVLPAPGLCALAGDAFGAPRIEGAFLSGYAAAMALLGEA
jgi:renalase